MTDYPLPARCRPTRLLPRAIPVLLLATVPLAALADPGSTTPASDPFNFVAGGSVTHDANLFRLPSGRSPSVNGQNSRSETTTTAFAGLRIDQPVSLQRFQLELTGTRYEHQNFDYLNFSTIDYRGAWLWSVTPRLTGTLLARQSKTPTSYADLNTDPLTEPGVLGRRNVHTNQEQRFDADWWVGGAWHALGGLAHNVSKNAIAVTAQGDYRQDSAEAGIKYVSPASNSLTMLRREARGDYLNRNLDVANLLDTHYEQRETEVQGFWRTSGHTSIDARLGYLERRHEHFSARDYSGLTGQLSYLWTPTGKLSINLLAGRLLNTYQLNSATAPSSYYVATYASLTPSWRAGEKTTVRLRLETQQRDFRGGTLGGGSERQDTLRSAQLGANWQPGRNITVDGYLTHEMRSSNLSEFDYSDNVIGINARLAF